jgi:5-methylcytosine-specific restriction endonuclease McrA
MADVDGEIAMPIRPENRELYPPNWPEISRRIRLDRARNQCEGCGAENSQPHPETGAQVVLTVAHLDHDPRNCDDDNLRAWCQKCHNSYDAPVRRAGIRERRDRAAGQMRLAL